MYFKYKSLFVLVGKVQSEHQEASSIHLCFFWKVVRQNDTDVMSRLMQLKKEGRGLLREANWSERECFVR